MSKLKIIFLALMVALLTACGGGGGSAGTTSTGGGTGTVTPTVVISTPTLVLQLVDSAGTVTTTVGNIAPVFAKATLRTGAGAVVSGQVVTFVAGNGLVRFSPSGGTALTDVNGNAAVQIFPALPTSAGAGTISANATVDAAAASKVISFVVPVSVASSPSISLALRNSANASTNVIDRTSATTARAIVLSAGGTPVSGALVTFTGNSAQVQFSPASGAVLTDISGVATVGIAAASGSAAGAGVINVAVNVGGTSVSESFNYQLASATSAGLPTLALGLFNSANVSTNSVEIVGATTARATLLDASGAPVAGRIVTFSADAGLVRLNPASGQVLTNAAGVASIQITPATLLAAGAGTVNAAATVGTTALANSFDYQLSAANVALQTLNLGSGSLAAFGSRPVSVLATINGSPAVNTPIQVSFAASCGLISPATITTDSTGRAAATYSANVASCAGTNVTISASTPGTTALNGSIAILPSLATNIQFISASPQLIYLKGSVGATQSQIRFRVVDSSGNGLQNQAVSLSLQNPDPGVSINTDGSTAAVRLTSDVNGEVSVAVFSGTVPTSLVVQAVLDANNAVAATSNVLTVASGLAVQSRSSLALGKLSLEGRNFDGDTTPVTMSLSDRQGNPVPDGTQINFVTQAGVMIPASCVISGGASQCSVSIRTQGTRTANGRVAILAYVPGEEDFVDANFNNAYDPGEVFADLGNAYRDDNASNTYTAGEFTVPRSGSSTCAGGINGRLNTCDGVWGKADVRVQTTIIFAGGTPTFANTVFTPTGATPSGFSALVGDVNGNSLPTGTTISAATASLSGSCVATVRTIAVANTLVPSRVVVALARCASGDTLTITTTTPLGLATSTSFGIP